MVRPIWLFRPLVVMALMALGRAFSLVDMASFAKGVRNTVIFKARLDTFKSRVISAVAEDTLMFTQTR